MSDQLDDLDALFDEISAQSQVNAQLPDLKDAVSFEADTEVEVDALEIVQVESSETHSAEHKPCECVNGDMFDRLGPIVRQLHDALQELGYDRSLSNVMDQVSDSQDRLAYIAQLTEQAANKVLNLVDEALPEQDTQLQESRALKARWEAMYAGQLSVDEFKVLAADSHGFIVASERRAEKEKARLMDIMMAQDFQDISGQIINKVVALTQQLERELAQLLRDYAPGQVREKVVDLLSGPVAPSAALVQDDVDQMLAELGF